MWRACRTFSPSGSCFFYLVHFFTSADVRIQSSNQSGTYGHQIKQSIVGCFVELASAMDQSGKVANPTRGQLNREK